MLQDFVAAAERVHLRLRERLSVFLGPTGFDSLWSRAMNLAQRTFPASVRAGEEDGNPLLPGLHVTVSGGTGDEIQDLLLAALTSFITLLFTFVGADLGFRLIHQSWPQFLPAISGDHTGAATS